MRLIIFVSLILQIAHTCAAISSSNSSEEQRITWGLIPYAPIHIVEGEYKGQGIADQYVKSAQENLIGYQHVNEIMTPARAWYLIAEGEELVCNPSSIKTSEREKIAYFTEAALITPIARVLMRKTDWQDRLKGVNKLSITDYIDANNGVFGVVSQRSYGEKIDEVLAVSIASGKQIIQTYGEHGSRQLYEMLVHGRIDMMIEYPWVIAYFKKTLEAQPIEVVNLEIADFPRFSPAYVACSRNTAGKIVIDKLNKFIRKAVLEPGNRQRMSNWLDEKEAADFEKDYLEYFKIAH